METIQEVLIRIVKEQIIIYENGQQIAVPSVTLYENGAVVMVTGGKENERIG